MPRNPEDFEPLFSEKRYERIDPQEALTALSMYYNELGPKALIKHSHDGQHPEIERALASIADITPEIIGVWAKQKAAHTNPKNPQNLNLIERLSEEAAELQEFAREFLGLEQIKLIKMPRLLKPGHFFSKYCLWKPLPVRCLYKF
jgi:hypothetical protein